MNLSENKRTLGSLWKFLGFKPYIRKQLIIPYIVFNQKSPKRRKLPHFCDSLLCPVCFLFTIPA